jgi:O-antigen ligase
LERVGFAAGGSDVTPTKAMLLLTGMAAAGHLILATEQRRRLHSAFIAFGGLLLVMALGIAVAPEPFTTIKILIQWGAYLAIAIYLANATIPQLRGVLLSLATSGAVLGVISVMTREEQTLSAGGQAATGRAEGSFSHPAILAFFLVLTLPPAIVLAFKSKPAARPFLILAAALCLAGITLSLTRGAILGAALALAILAVWQPFRRTAGVLLVGLLIFSAFNYQSIERSQQFRVIGDRLSSITETRATADNERVLIWGKTPAIIADHPFIGVGAGNFGEISVSYGIVEFGGASFVHAHNVILTIAAENGIAGLFFFLWFVGAVAMVGWKVISRGRGSPLFPYALALTAALAGLFLNGMTDYPPSILVIMATIMIEIGALVGYARRVVPGEEDPDESLAVREPHSVPGAA